MYWTTCGSHCVAATCPRKTNAFIIQGGFFTCLAATKDKRCPHYQALIRENGSHIQVLAGFLDGPTALATRRHLGALGLWRRPHHHPNVRGPRWITNTCQQALSREGESERVGDASSVITQGKDGRGRISFSTLALLRGSVTKPWLKSTPVTDLPSIPLSGGHQGTRTCQG